MYLSEDRQIDEWNRIECRNSCFKKKFNLCISFIDGQLTFNKVAKAIQWENGSLSNKGSGIRRLWNNCINLLREKPLLIPCCRASDNLFLCSFSPLLSSHGLWAEGEGVEEKQTAPAVSKATVRVTGPAAEHPHI